MLGKEGEGGLGKGKCTGKESLSGSGDVSEVPAALSLMHGQVDGFNESSILWVLSVPFCLWNLTAY